MYRCAWANGSDIEKKYHDDIWGVPCYDDHELFKKLILDGMQAGLSWLTILKKQSDIEKAFDDFDIPKILLYDDDKVEALMQNPGIIRNRLKIKSVITNAKAFIDIQKSHQSFSNYLWSFVDFTPIDHQIKSMKDIPTRNDLSDKISKDLKEKGFKFCGTTIIYAYLQAIGIINDHETHCFRYADIKKSSTF
jgi:DNA-3-methyladenine glycosylase I